MSASTLPERPAAGITPPATSQPFPAIPAKDDSDTTLGRSIFQDGIYGSRTISDIRNQLELKYATCLSTGSANGFPIDITEIENPLFRQISAAAVSSKGWTIKDLVECHDRLAIPAEGILIATLESPIWGEDDVHVFHLLRTLKAYQRKSQHGGRTL